MIGQQLERTDHAAETYAARGSLRDGLAALQNLENLLRSPRIGPRALEKIVGQLRSSCGTTAEAFEQLTERIAGRGNSPQVMQSLGEYARSRIGLLEASLTRAAAGDMGAKPRLMLEADVRLIGSELHALRTLVELLDAATSSNRTELDFEALFNEVLVALAPPAKKGRSDIVVVSVHVPTDRPTVVTDPRVIIPLVSLAIGLVARSGGRALEIRAFSQEDCTGFMVLPSLDGSAKAPCVPPLVIVPTLDAARHAASEVGARFEFDESSNIIKVEVPTSPSQTFQRPRQDASLPND